jgi:hypothetical protein
VALFRRKTAAVGDHIQTILENLCHLEINTIINNNMTGEKMPVPEQALVGLAADYDRWLSDPTRIPRGAEDGPVTGGPKEFQRLRDRADALQTRWRADTSPDPARDSDFMIACRIQQTSDQLLKIFQGAAKQQAVGDYTSADAHEHPIELAPDEIVVLRKAWELGTENVVLQTVIQLDGDVVHRVKRQYVDGEHTTLFRLHEIAIQTSVSYWKTLVEVAGEFIGGVGRFFESRV